MERSVHQVAFASGSFPPDPTEAGRDDGPHGMALAWWIEGRLRAASIEVGEPFPEDFGWLVEVRGPGRVVVSCGATEVGATDFVVTVEDVPRRFRRPDPEAAALVAQVVATLDAGLAGHPDVRGATWMQGGPSTT